jgi:hypothetical protein
MDAPLRSFRSWFLRIECALPGRERYAADTHMATAGLGDQRIGDLLARMRYDGCGGRPAFVELLTGIPGASRPVRRIVLIEREGTTLQTSFVTRKPAAAVRSPLPPL